MQKKNNLKEFQKVCTKYPFHYVVTENINVLLPKIRSIIPGLEVQSLTREDVSETALGWPEKTKGKSVAIIMKEQNIDELRLLFRDIQWELNHSVEPVEPSESIDCNVILLLSVDMYGKLHGDFNFFLTHAMGWAIN